MAITRERFELALDQLGPNDGSIFEHFANAYLAVEMPDLRPVGGMHDAGRDAFLYHSEKLPDAIVQHSTTPDWKRKIRDTVQSLRKAGHRVTHLTYTTPRSIAGKVDALRIELRSEGVLLDVRDREYFVTHVSSVPARQELAETLARQFVDPLLVDRGVLKNVAVALTDEDERVASTYLQLEMGTKDPAKAVTKSVFEGLVLYALREATPESLVPRSAVYTAVARFTPASESERVRGLVDGTLKRLTERDVIKHHSNEDAFALAYAHRVEMANGVEHLLADRAAVRAEVEDHTEAVAQALGVDFSYDTSAVALDALTLADHVLCARGRLAALALVKSGSFYTRRESLTAVAEQCIRDYPRQFAALDQLGIAHFVDLVPSVLERVLTRPSEAIARRLRSASDAYCALCALRETADVQGAIDKVFRGARALVDTSIVIPCMAEQLLPQQARRMTNLLRVAATSGIQLYVGEDVLNELRTHLERLVITYRRHTMGSVGVVGGMAAAVYQPLLIATYLTAGAPGTFEGFIERFMGKENPRYDLAEFLKTRVGN